MPKQIITSSQAPTTGFTPGQAVSPLAQAIRFGNMLFVSGQGSLIPRPAPWSKATLSCRRAGRSTI